MSSLLDQANAALAAIQALRDAIAAQEGSTPTPQPPTPPTPIPPVPPTPQPPPVPSPGTIRLPRPPAGGVARVWEGDINEPTTFVFNAGNLVGMGRLTMEEFGDQPVRRHAILSATPGGQPLTPQNAEAWGIAFTFNWFVGAANPLFPQYPVLALNTDYYVTVAPDAPGHVFIDLK